MTVDRKIINDLDFQGAQKVKNAVDGTDPQDYATVAQLAAAGAVSSVFGRTGAVAAVAGDYYGVVPAALTGATQASRFVGATVSGAPVAGTFEAGDFVLSLADGKWYVCTVGGTPGTWVTPSGGAGVTYGTPAVVLGTAAANGSIDEAIRRDSTIVAFDATVPSTQAFGDAAATGSAAVAARRDHKHAMPATPTSVSGNAGTATALQTGRAIDGQTFDGTADITVIAPGTHAATSKTTPVDADELPLVDTGASNVLKKLTLTNLKAFLKTYFDTLYAASGGGGIPQATKVLRTAGNFTTTSSTFVDVTGLTVTITTGAHRVLIIFSGTVTCSAAGGVTALDVAVDGTRQGGTLGLVDINPSANNFDLNGSFTYLTDVLSAGSHTFKLQTRSSGGATVTINASGTYPAQFSVIELPV